MKIPILLFCCTLTLAMDSKITTNLLIQSPTGYYQGSTLKTHSGKTIYAFRGIRYAEAPTGSKRFKQANSVEPHEGIFNATENGPICPQPDVKFQIISEDCLRLNVYTTKLQQNSSDNSSSDKSIYPVIVFINPGAVATSSGSSYELGPRLVLEQNVVFVTINYRLGALGFFSTGDERAPGNAGLKDQVLALRWIQQNIRAFGGDPNKVTLMGHCVGAMSVLLHIVSPMSKGLFHRALSMSSYASKESLPTNSTDFSLKQAELLGCPIDTLDNMFNCLYEKSTEEFVNSYEKRAKFHGHRVNWSPVIELTKYFGNNSEEQFLKKQPVDVIQEGAANFVPFLTGANVDEFGFAVIAAEEQAQSGDSKLYDELNDNWEHLAPKRFDYQSDTERSLNISKGLRSFYLHNELLKAGNYQGLAKLYADSLTFFQVHRSERLMATHSSEPVWYYKYNYENCDSYKKWSNGTRFGIVHFDELFLLFEISNRPVHCQRDLERAQELWKLFANFADVGEPMLENDDENSFKWKKSTKDQPQYLEYKGKVMEMVKGVIYPERMNKWDELFPL